LTGTNVALVGLEDLKVGAVFRFLPEAQRQGPSRILHGRHSTLEIEVGRVDVTDAHAHHSLLQVGEVGGLVFSTSLDFFNLSAFSVKIGFESKADLAFGSGIERGRKGGIKEGRKEGMKAAIKEVLDYKSRKAAIKNFLPSFLPPCHKGCVEMKHWQEAYRKKSGG
jgi:hypothetical protein